MKEFVKKFKSEHKSTFIKNNKIYSYASQIKDIKEFLKLVEYERNAKKIKISVS